MDAVRAEVSRSGKTPDGDALNTRYGSPPPSLSSTKVCEPCAGLPALLMEWGITAGRCEGLPQLVHAVKYTYHLLLFQKSNFSKQFRKVLTVAAMRLN